MEESALVFASDVEIPTSIAINKLIVDHEFVIGEISALVKSHIDGARCKSDLIPFMGKGTDSSWCPW